MPGTPPGSGYPTSGWASGWAACTRRCRPKTPDPATLRRTVGMDCELTDAGQTSGGSFAGLAGELARAIDAYEQLGIDDLIIHLQPSTQPALDRLARAIKIRGH